MQRRKRETTRYVARTETDRTKDKISAELNEEDGAS